ncbi:MAG: DUF4124 domain-containing protein [Ottowia sp.]|nr:DUF4124 domain-containing protein [Ottowia sp.]
MSFCIRALLTCLAALGLASGNAAEQEIYTCVDDAGNTITSDRPIPACSDRAQRVLGRSGTTLRIVEPEPTAAEREAEERRQRAEAQQQRRERARLRELAQRDRALLIRYPDHAAHEHARKAALEQIDAAISAATSHIAVLARERRSLDTELEFYEGNPDQVPAELRRTIARNSQATDIALKLIASQEAERDRINAHYDEEAELLDALWRAQAESTAEAPASAAGQ